MKKFFFFILILLLILAGIGGYFGLIPGVSALFGSDKPRNLGVNYTEIDLSSGRTKAPIIYETTTNGAVWQTSGSIPIDTEITSQELTAIMNNKKGAYYPYKNVQVKFNADGSGEISATLIKSRLPLYGSTFDAPKIAVDFAMKVLPDNPVVYLKGKATLVDNKVGLFEPQRFEIGRIPLPVGMFLSLAPKLIPEAYALDVSQFSELSKIENKRALIIDFINSRLSAIPGFYAKSAKMTENKLLFEGTLPEKEITAD